MNFTPYLKYSDVLIETGTCIGDGVQSALDAGFNVVKSVEASKPHYIKSNSRFRGDKRVTIYYGLSYDRLPEMIAGIPCPSVFWLDAHPAGPATFGHEEWQKGDSSVFMSTIIKKELDIILADGPHVILIDDMNSWETTREYTAHIDAICPETYSYQLVDDVRGSLTYKEKVLICLPVL